MITEFSLFLLLFDSIYQTGQKGPAIILGTCALPVTKETKINRCCQTSWNLLHHFLALVSGKISQTACLPWSDCWLGFFPKWTLWKEVKCSWTSNAERRIERSLENLTRAPPLKIQWETSALNPEEGWETFGPGNAYNPQSNVTT